VSGLAPNFLETSLPAWNSYYQHEWQLGGIILPKNAKIGALQMRGLSMRHPVERSTVADPARAAKVGAFQQLDQDALGLRALDIQRQAFLRRLVQTKWEARPRTRSS
jgi:hypothetical protein